MGKLAVGSFQLQQAVARLRVFLCALLPSLPDEELYVRGKAQTLRWFELDLTRPLPAPVNGVGFSQLHSNESRACRKLREPVCVLPC